LGTALTQEQVRLLKRYTSNVVMVYDPDAAGQMATLRSLDIFIEEGMSVKVASLPQGCDPDLFVRKSGIQAFQDKIANAETLFDYKLNSLRSKHDARQIEGRSRICSEMLPVISKFTDAVLKTGYLKKLSEELSVEEDALLQELKKVKTEKPYAEAGRALPRKPLDIRPAEKLLIKLMLEESGLIGRVRDCLVPADFQDERASKIVSLMFELLEQGRSIEPNLLASRLQDDATVECICESAFLPEVSLEKKEQILNDCVRRIKDEKIKSTQQRLHEEIKAAQHLGDEEKVNRLMQEFHELIKTR
jgi:DNA primase